MPEVEAVVICLPTHLHADAAIAAFEAGKNVYLEKPLATNLAEGRKMLAAWKTSGRIGMIGFNNRFNPLYQMAKQHLQEGRIGNLVGGRATVCSAARQLPTWKQSRHSGGGALPDLAIHQIDLVHFLFNRKIGEVFATVRSVRSEDDNASLQIRLDNGLVIQGFFSMTALLESRFEFYEDEGKLVVDQHAAKIEFSPPERSYKRLYRLRTGLKQLWRTPRELWNVLMPPVDPSYERALRSFVDSIVHAGSAEVDLVDGYQSLVVVHAAEESARTGRPVSLQEIADEYSIY
jgi:predicted dehydrogenase